MNTDRQRPVALRRMLRGGLLLLVLLSSAGCVRAMALMGKAVLGDPKLSRSSRIVPGSSCRKKSPRSLFTARRRCRSPMSVNRLTGT